MIQSAAHSKIPAQAIPLFLLSQFSLSSSPIQNCSALTQHNTHPLTPSTPSLPLPLKPNTIVSTSYFFVITAKSKVLLISAATRLAFSWTPIGSQHPLAPSSLVASSQARCRLSHLWLHAKPPILLDRHCPRSQIAVLVCIPTFGVQRLTRHPSNPNQQHNNNVCIPHHRHPCVHPIPLDSTINFKSHFGLRRARNCVCDVCAASKLRRTSPEQLCAPELPLTAHQDQSFPGPHFDDRLGCIADFWHCPITN